MRSVTAGVSRRQRDRVERIQVRFLEWAQLKHAPLGIMPSAQMATLSARVLKTERRIYPRALRELAQGRIQAAENRAKHILSLCNLLVSGPSSSTRR